MNYNITPERFLEIVQKTKPTGNVYVDTYAVKHFGEYIYSVINYQKWKSCNTLENDVFKCITELYPLTMTQLAKITQILKESKDEVADPSYTKTTIDKYVIEEYNKTHNISNSSTITIENIDRAKSYLEFSQTLYTRLTTVYKKYESEWQNIEDSYDCVGDKMEEIYKDLEDVYCKFDEEIDIITNLVDNKIISRYNQILNEQQLERDITDTFNDVMTEVGTDEETKNLINTITVSQHISFHKLNYTMTCGILKLIN
jgi:hypothetical protein